ncbi:MAG: hypothetical protein AB1511_13110 [Deinococcota bacterium]
MPRSASNVTAAKADPATCHPTGHLCMPEDARKRAARRLKIARGHLDSIVAMLDKG